MTIKSLGDSAWLLELSEQASLVEVLGWVAALEKNRPQGVLDVVSAFTSVAVHFSEADGQEIFEWMRSVRPTDQSLAGSDWEIPVIYGGEDGPDLEEVARHTGKSVCEVIELHAAGVYTVAALGFSPGFPYLSGLPQDLHLPRKRTPRHAVPAGSVAIAGSQAGIYPNASPAGWHVLGRTNIPLFDPNAARPALFKPGDRVRFVPSDDLPPGTQATEAEELAVDGWIEVIHPGGLTTVQDLGRPGHEACGVSPGGAVNRWALRVANAMVGNEPGAAALECCVSGPVLKFHRECTVALVASTGKSRHIAAGEIVDFSKLHEGVRAYLAVAGGLSIPDCLGSAATDLRAGFGGRRLIQGDRLACKRAGAVPLPGGWSVGRGVSESVLELRVLRGVQAEWFSEETLGRFYHDTFQVTPLSDRMGVRLSGPPLRLREVREMASQPVACGSVQVPPDGQPIVLMAERQTLGGYPQIGHVISVDLPKLAGAWPGTQVKFLEVTRSEAVQLMQDMEREFAWLQTGLKLRFSEM